MRVLKNNFILTAGPFKVHLGGQTKVMGILNVTPDSFSDPGRYFSRERAIAHALQMEDDGADFIDIGGESSRPGAQPVSFEEEIERVIPLLEEIVPRLKIPVSVDTFKPEVARRAIEAGASIINDIRALAEPGMKELVSARRVPVVLMHMKGMPETMQMEPAYQAVVTEIALFFKERIQTALSAGIRPEQIIIDPGIGFGKTASHNLEILRSLDQFHTLGCPVLVGTSNKSFIGKILDRPVEKRLAGSLATVAWAVWKGAHIVRVHEVGATKDLIRIIEAIQSE
jgi:dihydropteroate synthase